MELLWYLLYEALFIYAKFHAELSELSVLLLDVTRWENGKA